MSGEHKVLRSGGRSDAAFWLGLCPLEPATSVIPVTGETQMQVDRSSPFILESRRRLVEESEVLLQEKYTSESWNEGFLTVEGLFWP